ncbi:MAG: DUF721 domain-containing protein [Patescibacteria group bacterium]
MESIKRILPQVIKKAGISRQVEAVLVLEAFSVVVKKILGENVTKRIKPLHLKNRTLTVACLSSVLAQELQLNQQQVIQAINRKFSQTVVEKLRFLT